MQVGYLGRDGGSLRGRGAGIRDPAPRFGGLVHERSSVLLACFPPPSTALGG